LFVEVKLFENELKSFLVECSCVVEAENDNLGEHFEFVIPDSKGAQIGHAHMVVALTRAAEENLEELEQSGPHVINVSLIESGGEYRVGQKDGKSFVDGIFEVELATDPVPERDLRVVEAIAFGDNLFLGENVAYSQEAVDSLDLKADIAVAFERDKLQKPCREPLIEVGFDLAMTIIVAFVSAAAVDGEEVLSIKRSLELELADELVFDSVTGEGQLVNLDVIVAEVNDESSGIIFINFLEVVFGV